VIQDFSIIILVALLAFFLWLVGLTVVFYRLLRHYKRIASRVRGGDLIKVLSKVLDSEEDNKKDLLKVKKEIERIDKSLLKPIQKVGLVRFNPFAEIGGDHSFSLCLLDQEDNGFIITSLHTRDRTRVYTKPVSVGVSKFELSKEEEKALKQAQKS